VETSGPIPEPAKPTSWLSCVLVLGILFVLIVVSIGPMPGGLSRGPVNSPVQRAHAIGLAVYSYANDNDQQYPDGASSTEVFQKLLDGGYVTDPTLFYIPMPGKVKPVAGQKLKPENVSWDITAPVAALSPGELPLLFMTGYKVNYVSGGSATPAHGIPQYGYTPEQPAWKKWMGLAPQVVYEPSQGIAVFYVNNSTVFSPYAAPISAPDGSIPNFVPPDFKPDGKTYRQLTPDGVMK
jgi:hypothetical protein